MVIRLEGYKWSLFKNTSADNCITRGESHKEKKVIWLNGYTVRRL